MVFFFNDTATTEIYTLSLHDALPISAKVLAVTAEVVIPLRLGMTITCRKRWRALLTNLDTCLDRKSTRLNSSHANISYAVFCLKKKKITTDNTICLIILYKT